MLGDGWHGAHGENVSHLHTFPHRPHVAGGPFVGIGRCPQMRVHHQFFIRQRRSGFMGVFPTRLDPVRVLSAELAERVIKVAIHVHRVFLV